MNIDISSVKGVIIYQRWLLVDNELYLVKDANEKGVRLKDIFNSKASDNEKQKKNFERALVFFVYEDGEVDIQYDIKTIPIGVVRKAKAIFKTKLQEDEKDNAI